ncbi:MAG: TatD family hydrolase, partial [Lachnospiraceae bacterium]|nr:TatD family hydrolase [Lachnospiraceae bacterium]
FRGKRNCSLYIPYVVEELARIKGLTPEEVRKQAWTNAHNLYRMKE